MRWLRAWWDSILGRSIVAVVGTTLLVWLAWSAYLLWHAARADSSLFDEELRISAQVVVTAFPKVVIDQRLTLNYQLPDGVQATYEFNYQVWTRDRRLVSRATTAPETPLNPSFAPGFHTQFIDGQTWRSYTMSDASGEIVVQVGDRLNQRRDLARLTAVQGLVDLSWLIVALAVALIGTSIWTVRPLRRLQQQVGSRSATDGTALPHEGLPSEVRPVVLAFNGLLARAEQARLAEQRFLADAAHELRTPLAALRVQAQVALRSREPLQQQAALQRLLAGIDRSTRVVEQLLEMARVEPQVGPQAPAPLHLAELGQELAEACAPLAARRGVGLHVDLPDEHITSHAVLLHAALRNLLDNALRYSPPGSVVRLSAQAEAGCWRLTVQDQGPGLSEEQREAALRPFVRLHEGDETGSGLGLTIVQRVAKRLGATLRLEPVAPAPGLSASLMLPAS